jgi:hypothetical protein
MANGMESEQISAICLEAMYVMEGALGEEEQIAFLQFREYLCLLQQAADESQTTGEINQRFLLGSGSRIVTLLTNTPQKGTRP